MNTPTYTAGTELLVRFPTRAQKRLGEPGATYLSRQATNLPVGTVLEVVEDFGKGYLWVRRGAVVFQVHATDLMPRPTDTQVAHEAVQALIAGNLLKDTEEALKLAEAEVTDLKAKLAEANKWTDSARAQRDAREAERDEARTQRDEALRRLAGVAQALSGAPAPVAPQEAR